MLKLNPQNLASPRPRQPPSGGCVLKPNQTSHDRHAHGQPPSGGCVLKHSNYVQIAFRIRPAAFGRLCVETMKNLKQKIGVGAQPPSGGCVLKQAFNFCQNINIFQPPSGGCVLKQISFFSQSLSHASRLRAAVC